MPSPIGLITDFGLQDEYAGVMKAVILSISPFVQVVDISHGIAPRDVMQAGFILKASAPYFPKGSVLVAVVDPGVGTERKILCASVEDRFFLAPDNGLLSLVMDENPPSCIVSVTSQRFFLERISHTFHGRDIFAPVAAHLANGYKMEDLGEKLDPADIYCPDIPRVRDIDNHLEGVILFADRFGNLATNISGAKIQKKFDTERKDLEIRVSDHVIKGLSEVFADAAENDLLALIGSRGYLEICINGANAAKSLRAEKNHAVVVQKKE